LKSEIVQQTETFLFFQKPGNFIPDREKTVNNRLISGTSYLFRLMAGVTGLNMTNNDKFPV